MPITPDGWFDFLAQDLGPIEKQYSQPNSAEWVIPHSAVGYYNGWLSRLRSMDRLPDGRFTPYAAASVHGFITYDGSGYQHYPITSSCWASGAFIPNTKGIAFEFEGGPPGNETEPLTEAQLQTLCRIILDLTVHRQTAVQHWRRPEGANDKLATLLEHNECKRFGAAATACPSNRIPWEELTRRVWAGTYLPAPPPSPLHPDGWYPEGPYQILYNQGVDVLRIGGDTPGMFAKRFGDQWFYLRNTATGEALWTLEPGD